MKSTFLLVSIILLLATVSRADDLERLTAKGQVIIGVRENSPPFAFFDKAKGSVSGYDIDFALLVARKLGLVAVFKTVEPLERIPALKDGRVDILFASFTKNPERDKEVDFSIGYFVSTQKMVAKKGTFHDVRQLDKLTVCVPKGTTNAKNLQELSPTVQIRFFEDYAEIFKALSEGLCEYASGPDETMLGNLLKMPEPSRKAFEVSDVPLAFEVFAAGIRNGEKRLQRAVNEVLLDAEKTGEAARIFDRWFGGAGPVHLNRIFKIMQ